VDQNQAEALYQLIIGTIIPIVVSSMKQASWPNYQKFGLVFVISLVAASVVPMAQFTNSGEFDFGKMALMLGGIFTTTQVIYQGAFKYLEVESTVNPKAALLSLVKDQISHYIETISDERVKSIIDPESEHSLEVTINETQHVHSDM
jgi:uncharacterized membrane protein